MSEKMHGAELDGITGGFGQSSTSRCDDFKCAGCAARMEAQSADGRERHSERCQYNGYYASCGICSGRAEGRCAPQPSFRAHFV